MKKLYIIGAGGLGREIACWARQSADHGRAWSLAGFLDDDPGALDGKDAPAAWVGRPDAHEPREDEVFVVAIGKPDIRRRIQEEFARRGARFASVIHPSALVATGAHICDGTMIAPFAVVSTDARIGRGVLLNHHTTVQHDAVVGDWSQLNSHADVGGGAIVGAGVLLGARTTIGPKVRVGDGNRIAPGLWMGADLEALGPEATTTAGRVGTNLVTNRMEPSRIHLSPPHMEGNEPLMLLETLDSGWIAPAGPALPRFEKAFCDITGASHAVAVSSCTAAIHLALLVAGVVRGDEVLCSTFTFTASANPILMVGAEPVFIDSEADSWNLDPRLLEHAILERIRIRGRAPKALILVHIFGQSADLHPIARICREHGVILIEDAAEALGALYMPDGETPLIPGTVGDVGTFSFNGNKIVTCGGGGMLVTRNPQWAERGLFLATQARDAAPHYQHSTLGYNYRLSNVLAALGIAQLEHLRRRVEQRRANFAAYREGLADLPGLRFMPEPSWSRSTRWLNCLTLDPEQSGVSCEDLRLALAAENIEARPVWKPLHLQPLFHNRAVYGGSVSQSIFDNGLCLPSGSNLRPDDLKRIIGIIRKVGWRTS